MTQRGTWFNFFLSWYEVPWPFGNECSVIRWEDFGAKDCSNTQARAIPLLVDYVQLLLDDATNLLQYTRQVILSSSCIKIMYLGK